MLVMQLHRAASLGERQRACGLKHLCVESFDINRRANLNRFGRAERLLSYRVEALEDGVVGERDLVDEQHVAASHRFDQRSVVPGKREKRSAKNKTKQNKTKVYVPLE